MAASIIIIANEDLIMLHMSRLMLFPLSNSAPKCAGTDTSTMHSHDF